MFNQTRRAFTSSITQVDILNRLLRGGHRHARWKSHRRRRFIQRDEFLRGFAGSARGAFAYLTQAFLDPKRELQSATFREVFFITRNNLQWSVVGYRLLPPTVNDPDPAKAGIGTLYRYNVPNIALTNVALLTNAIRGFYNTLPNTNFSRLIDGVVDFRVRTLGYERL